MFSSNILYLKERLQYNKLGMSTINDFDQFYIKFQEDETKFADSAGELEFISDEGKKIDILKKAQLNSEVDRADSIGKFMEEMHDVNMATKMEASVFEFALVYVHIKNYLDVMLSATYRDKIYDIIWNLQRTDLKARVLAGDIEPQEIAFLSPQELGPECWKTLIRKNELREFKKNNMAATDLYKCKKCGDRRCSIMELQTRACDEGSTTFVTCLTCGNTFKRGG
jgi:DNA-directed RNA polymerase subunit M/transcription elongation factor TFIIS